MPKKVWLVIFWAALAAVEAAVGVLISPFAAILLLIASIPLAILAYSRLIKTSDITSSDIREFQYRVEKRRAYLPQLQQALDALLEKQYELADKAGQLSLEEYRDKFLKLSLKYRIIRVMASGLVGKLVRKFVKDEKEIILMALRQENFIKNNLYIRELEQKDDYQKLWREYNKWYSQTQEKPLRGLMSNLIKSEKLLSSTSSMAQVARREIIKSPRILASLYNWEARVRNLVEYQHRLVNDEFRELLEVGKPD